MVLNCSRLTTLWSKKLILIIIIFSYCGLFAQEKQLKIKLEYVIPTKIPYYPDPFKFLCKEINNEVYWLSYSKDNFWTSDKKNFAFYIKGFIIPLQKVDDYSLLKYDTFKVYFKSSQDPINISALSYRSMGLSESHMILSTTKHHKVFKRINRNVYEEIQDFNASKFHLTDFKYIGDDKFLCASMYTFDLRDDQSPYKLVLYDIKKNRIESSILSNYNGIDFTYFVNEFISFGDSYFAVANTLDYNIYLYNYKLEVIDTIRKSFYNWQHYKGIKDTANKSNTKSTIENLMLEDDEIHRIEKIFLVNDSTLFVSIKEPKTKKKRSRTIDIWKYSQGKWINSVEEQKISYQRELTDTISKETYKPNLSMSSPILFSGDKIISILVGNDLPARPMLVSDYRKMIEKKYSNEEERYNIFIYKWEIE